MKTFLRWTIGMAALACAGAWAAEDPPAVREAPAASRDALRATIAAAAKEGELSYWDVVIQPSTSNALVEGFKRHYGLPASFKVNYSLSASGALVTRMEQELKAGRVTMDVVAIASPSWVHEKIKEGHIMQYASPQYVHYKQAFAKGLGREGYFAFNGAYLFVPMWSSDKLDFKGATWKDVLGAVPAGRMSFGDVTKSVTYLATYMGLRSVLGVDYFKQLAQMKPVFVLRSEQMAGNLVTGAQQFSFSGMPTRAFQYNQKGAKLKFVMPKEGVVLLAQSQFIFAKAPRPNAAKLWVDWVLSDGGQKIIVEQEGMISGRDGFKSPIPDYAPAIDNLNVIKIEWDKITTADLDAARKEWISIFNP